MEIGNTIRWGPVDALGLGALETTLPDSPLRREVRVYRVPEAMSSDRYYIGAKEAGEPRPAPPCRARDALELVRYQLDADGTASLLYVHPEVANA